MDELIRNLFKVAHRNRWSWRFGIVIIYYLDLHKSCCFWNTYNLMH